MISCRRHLPIFILSLAVLLLNATTLLAAQPGRILMTNGQIIKFSNIMKFIVDDYNTHIKIKSLKNIKKIEFQDSGKSYDGTKAGLGKLLIVRRDNRKVVLKRVQILARDCQCMRVRIINPVTDEVDESVIPIREIQSIEFD